MMDSRAQCLAIRHDEDVITQGVSEAVHALVEIVNSEINATPPRFLRVEAHAVPGLFSQDLPASFTAVLQEYSAPFDCQVMMAIAPESSTVLLRKLFGEELPPELLLELGTDGLAELGNVLFNACLAPVLDGHEGGNVQCTLPKAITGGSEAAGIPDAVKVWHQADMTIVDMEIPELTAAIRLALIFYSHHDK
jgi:chemotaxis protein CheC